MISYKNDKIKKSITIAAQIITLYKMAFMYTIITQEHYCLIAGFSLQIDLKYLHLISVQLM